MDIVDVMIHVHPDLSATQRTSIETELGVYKGVVSAHFSTEHPHELTVAYNPKMVNSLTLLEGVKNWDAEATMIGL